MFYRYIINVQTQLYEHQFIKYIRFCWVLEYFSLFYTSYSIISLWIISSNAARSAGWVHLTHLWPFSKSKLNLKSDHVNLVAPASPIDCLLYLPNVWEIQYKMGLERLTQLGNVLWLPVILIYDGEEGQFLF